ncbi:MAG: BatA and WFA domain-containing protein [Thermoguttaceae bacterium]|nr:BatA and WFA domain-containing protein [Thermoguttaceae bacterium]
MTFSTPFFLFGLVAAAIPVAIHLISRRTRRELPFPTLRFIRMSEQKTRRRRRIQDILLLLLRMAAFILLTLALAGPTLSGIRQLFGSGDGHQTAIAIVLDNSPSMQAMVDGQSRLETAKQYAATLLEPFDETTQIAVFPTSGPAFPEQEKLITHRETIDGMLTRCEVGGEASNLPRWIQKAKTLLAQSRSTNRLLIVLSDQQATAWNFTVEDAKGLAELQHTPDEFARWLDAKKTKNASIAEDMPLNGDPNAQNLTANTAKNPAGDTKESSVDVPGTPPRTSPSATLADEDQIPVFVIGVTGSSKANVAIRNVRWRQAAPLPNLPVELTVQLAETSGVAQDRCVELWLDGRREQTSPSLPLDAYGTTEWTLSTTFAKGGLHRLELRLSGEDGEKLDDSRFLTFRIAENIPVGILATPPHEIAALDTVFYLERALRPNSDGWAIRPVRFTVEQLTEAELQPTTLPILFCVDLPAPDAALATRLQQYLLRGGHIVWCLGDAVDPAAYNAAQKRTNDQLLPVSLGSLRIAAQEFAARPSVTAPLASDSSTATKVPEVANVPPTGESLSAQPAATESSTGSGESGAAVPSGDAVAEGGGRSRGGELRSATKDAWNLAWMDASSSIFDGLTEPPSLYQSVLVYRVFGLADDSNEHDSSISDTHKRDANALSASGVRTLARLDDDTPILLQKSVGTSGAGMGSTTLWMSGLQIGWTNLPLKKIFPAIILRIVSAQASFDSQTAGVDCGVGIYREEPTSTPPKTVEVVPPRGERLRFPMQSATIAGNSGTPNDASNSKSMQTLMFTQTSEPGVYEMRTVDAADPKPTALAVNIAASETYPDELAGKWMIQILSPNPVVFAGSAREAASALRQLQEGTNLENPLLYAVLIALIAEAFVANRHGGREEEVPHGASPTSQATNPQELLIRRFQ